MAKTHEFQGSTHGDDRNHRRACKRIGRYDRSAMALLLLGTNFMLSVDFSILNIALPEVGRAVGLDLANFPWVATAFALPAAGLSLLFGRLGDIYGRRRLFVGGLALLALASLMGGIATGPLLLLGAQALQGIATAMAAPAALALLITAFADAAPGRLARRHPPCSRCRRTTDINGRGHDQRRSEAAAMSNTTIRQCKNPVGVECVRQCGACRGTSAQMRSPIGILISVQSNHTDVTSD